MMWGNEREGVMQISVDELLQIAEHIKKSQKITIDVNAITIRVKADNNDKLLKPIKIQGRNGKEVTITHLGVYEGMEQTRYWVVKD